MEDESLVFASIKLEYLIYNLFSERYGGLGRLQLRSMYYGFSMGMVYLRCTCSCLSDINPRLLIYLYNKTEPRKYKTTRITLE